MRTFGGCGSWIALGATLLACGGPPPKEPSPAAQVAAAAATSPEVVAAAAVGTHCEAEVKLRARAFCYLQSGSEDAIDPLFELGRTLGHEAMASRVQIPAVWQDFTYAAENAGVLAAKTQDARLYAGLESPHQTYHLFAIVAIHHMLAILRQGNARGKDADAPVRAERLAKAHVACRAALGDKYGMMVTSAADCLKEIGDPTDGGPLLEAAVDHPGDSKLQSHLVDIAAALPPYPVATLQKLRPLLEQPMPVRWTQEDINLRSTICTILARELPASETWPQAAAAVAAREVGDARGGPARVACQTLAARTK
jgi:hypothetical protein